MLVLLCCLPEGTLGQPKVSSTKCETADKQPPTLLGNCWGTQPIYNTSIIMNIYICSTYINIKLEIRIRLKRTLGNMLFLQAFTMKTSNFRPFCCTRLNLPDKCKILIFNLHKVKFSFFWHFTCMGGWCQISVRFALRGLVSEINGKKKLKKKCYLKFSSVSLYEASFPKKKKKKSLKK